MSNLLRVTEDPAYIKDLRNRTLLGLGANAAITNYGIRRVHHSILDYVGNTPLVKLNKIPKQHGLSCDIFAKCEYVNPGGSIKDRIARSMMAAAERKGLVHRGAVFVEPTSGNTGIGIAFAATQTGHKSVVVTEEKNSSEKVNTLRLLGAEVIQTKNNELELAIANKIRDSDPYNHIMLDQFNNDVNPMTHFESTGQEILDAAGEVHALVAGVGTGGTLTGTGHRIKNSCPNCKIVAVEPDGSTMILKNRKAHPFKVEGIGGSWRPAVFDESLIDHVEVVTDEESFLMARELAKKEGLLCGASGGAAMAAAIKAAKYLKLGTGKQVVVILPDGIRNYMNKFVNDQWMESHLFLDPPQHTMRWWNRPITELVLKRTHPIIDKKYSCTQAVQTMNQKGVNVAIVVDEGGWFVGAVSKDRFRYSCTNPTKFPNLDSDEMNFKDSVTHHLVKHCHTLARNGRKGMPTIGRLARVLDITPFVVIGTLKFDDDVHGRFVPDTVATTDEVFDNVFNYGMQ